MTKEFDFRLRIISLVVVAFALVLVTKLYFVQIVSGDVYKERAEHQYVAGANYFNRGSIFFTTKDGVTVPAATVRSGFSLTINPTVLQREGNIEEVFERLNSTVPINREEFLAKANKAGDPYEEIAERLSSEATAEIQNLKIPGVSLYRERWRQYPGNTMAAHTVGFIGFKEDELAGRYGLERYYESVLSRTGDGAFVNFFAEIFSNIKKTVSSDETLSGDVITTIEPSVQAFLEGELAKVEERYGSEFSGGIVIDPKTGAIFAIALHPTFDPNTPGKERDFAVFRNKLIEDRYEMGSIIKAITMAAAIDAGAVTARTTYSDPGCMTLNSRTFCNYDLKSRGTSVTMQEVLSESLNTGVAFAVRQMGNQTFVDYMHRFGLGELTGIDLPNEGKSLISNLNTKRNLELAQASFGQGIALTPIITVRALSVLANGGKLITPHLVKEVKYNIGSSKTVTYDPGAQVISPETSEEISRMLTQSVDYTLRLGTVRLNNYSVAAKTGTAQIASPNGGYYDDRYLHSFFGYFPSYDPQFLIFLYTYHPKEVHFASETLTDSFMNTTKFLINYYNIPPDREAPPPLSNVR